MLGMRLGGILTLVSVLKAQDLPAQLAEERLPPPRYLKRPKGLDVRESREAGALVEKALEEAPKQRKKDSRRRYARFPSAAP